MKDFLSFIPSIARPSWDESFMMQAILAAARSTCLKRAVGAVLVRGKRVIASGYNGAPPMREKNDTCLDFGYCHYERIAEEDAAILGVGMEDIKEERKYLCLAVHAEANALAQCAALGTRAKGSVMYVTNFPCPNCVREHILAPGITELVYWKDYIGDEKLSTNEKKESVRLLKAGGVSFRHLALSEARIRNLAELFLLVGGRTEYRYECAGS